MGRQVPSHYRRSKSSLDLLLPLHNSSMESLQDPPTNLTPARKHHKLLKDGSEVWSKDVEKIFVQGLRLYWQSPWATYSRGRSRWRNQFLVDHLKKSGVDRTKKQVASHIQVLRNMWRDQPEFNLVAGGEELFQENGLLAQSDKDNKSGSASSDAHSPTTADPPDTYPASSSSSSTPERRTSPLAGPSSYASVSPPQSSPFMDFGSEDLYASTIAPPSAGDTHVSVLPPPSSATQPIAPVSVKLEPLAMDPALFTLPHPTYPDSAAHFALSIPNRISKLYFWADGMTLLSFDVDRLVGATPSSPSRTFLHFRISMPPFADLRCPPNLQGINGAIMFATPWSSIAKCHTKSWGDNRDLISQDNGFFSPAATPDLQAVGPSASQMVYAYLPDSPLNRCHWLETVHTITQQVVVDNEVLAVLVYHIQRVADASRQVPTMELIGLQKYPWRGPQPPSMAPAAVHTHPHAHSHLASPGRTPPVSPTSPTFAHASAGSPISPHLSYVPRSAGAALGPSMGVAEHHAPPHMLPYAYSTQAEFGFGQR